MPNPKNALVNLLDQNPHVHLAYLLPTEKGCQLHIHTTQVLNARSLNLAPDLMQLECIPHVEQAPTILRCPCPRQQAENIHQQCQNEPIRLGTQIQPWGKQWVGTAGAPVHWLDDIGADRYGILSNWHVMADGNEGLGHPQHQPDIASPPAAALADWQAVQPDQQNFYDVALADSLVNGKHTISQSIIGIGILNPEPITPTIGQTVIKSGRTTQLTQGKIRAVGAAVKVGYGGFTATFAEQIIIEHGSTPFSAGGDSGSLVVDATSHRPVGLLFAGGGGTTIANPLPALMAAFDLDFDV